MIKTHFATLEELIVKQVEFGITFNHHYTAPDGWVIEPNATITETCNPCRTSDCASGINVAIRNYNDFGDGDLWKCIIKPQWLGGVVVPYRTDGKIRTEKLQLIEIVGD